MKVFSQKDAENFAATGAKEFRYDRNVRLTPMGRDALVEAGIKVVFVDDAAAASSCACAAAPAAAAKSGDSSCEIRKLFNSPEAQALKEQICDIGHRCWLRNYNDGNGGNISVRLGDYFLCTPTGVSKGFLKPDMVCMVDKKGNQVAGNGPWKRTSEIVTHLSIYESTPKAMSVCHAHPIYATAFAIAGVEPPQCLVPEVEVFVGTIAVAPYATPGSPEMGKLIGELAPKHQSIMMGNHGLICWGTSVEDAYFKMEITDSYCWTVTVASQIPTRRTTIPGEKLRELLDMKKKMGLPDTRESAPACELCNSDPWEFIKDRPMACATPAGTANYGTMTNAEIEETVQQVTEQVLKQMGGRK